MQNQIDATDKDATDKTTKLLRETYKTYRPTHTT